jgi:putative flippase GtrA
MQNPLDVPIQMVAARFGDKAKDVERFLKFAVVGFVGALVDFGTLILMQATFFPPTDKLGNPITMNTIVATTVAFIAAILSNFTWNRLWTYPDSRSRSARRQLALFAFISGIGWLVRTIWIALAFHTLGKLFFDLFLPAVQIFRPAYIPSYSAEGKLGTIMAQLIAIVVVMFWNFFANKRWTYNDVE